MRTLFCFLLCLPCFAQATRLRAERLEDGKNITAHGTASCINGKWVTCAHVVKNSESVLIESRGSWIRCTVKKTDAGADLALLVPDFQVEATDEHAHGTFCYGAPEGKPVQRCVAKVCATVLLGEHVEIKGMAQGMSGSALTSDGEVIGMVTGFASLNGKAVEDCARFVSMALIKEFLK